MSLRRTPAFLVVIFFALVTASPSAAQYSMAGKWGVEPQSGFNLDLVQNAGVLTWNGSGTVVGTINEGTGEFHLDFGNQTIPGCGKLLVDGFVALDSLTFTGTISYGLVAGPSPHQVYCDYNTYPTQGSRCGNNVIDPGEGCDDDNGRDSDCCSSTCQYDAPGAVCTSDNQQCSDAFCDGAGTCVPGGPSASGTPCIDNNGCTTDDACDGTGVCAGGEPLDCGPCGTCEYGLCRSPYECEESFDPTGAAALAMSIGDEPGDDRLTFKFKDIVPTEELGDPTTTTQYSLCVAAFDDSFVPTPRPLLAFDLPVGGTCGTLDCWKATASGFKYKDKASSSDGISLAAAGTHGFKFKGKGALLPFGAELPTDELVVQVVSDDGVTRRCRQAFLTTSSSSATGYRGTFKP
jgi:hypothetical protein